MKRGYATGSTRRSSSASPSRKAAPSARATASSHFSRAAFRWETTVSAAQLFVVGKLSAATAEAIIEVVIAVMRVGLLLLVALSTQSD
ncbi:MAG: hypothetical protein ABSB34_13465 [Candidatus Limnocylindrales bacterium]